MSAETTLRETRDILTEDGVLDSIERIGKKENAARVTILIPAAREFITQAKTDLRNVVVSLRSKIARAGYELEYGTNMLTLDEDSLTLAVQGVLRPLVREFPTYHYPVEKAFRPGQRIARAFYEDPARKLNADDIRSAVTLGDILLPESSVIRPDGGVLIPIDHTRFVWNTSKTVDIQNIMHRALDGDVGRETFTGGHVLRAQHEKKTTLRKGEAVITRARFGMRHCFGVIQRANGTNLKTHFEARVLDPGSGIPHIKSGENGAIKLELHNGGTQKIQPENVLVYFYYANTSNELLTP